MLTLEPTIPLPDLCELQNRCLRLLQKLIGHLSVEEVMNLVAAAYRSWEMGSVLALGMREAAEEIELTGEFLFDKYGC